MYGYCSVCTEYRVLDTRLEMMLTGVCPTSTDSPSVHVAAGSLYLIDQKNNPVHGRPKLRGAPSCRHWPPAGKQCKHGVSTGLPRDRPLGLRSPSKVNQLSVRILRSRMNVDAELAGGSSSSCSLSMAASPGFNRHSPSLAFPDHHCPCPTSGHESRPGLGQHSPQL